MAKWTTDNIPDQSGKTIIVTGANSGLGYETTLALAQKGAHVIMACRNMEKGQRAHDEVKQHAPDASLDLMKLDLGDLASVREFAAAFREKYDALDVLINNAGLMAIPRRETKDGFEMQLGVNHLGHFALTGLLLDMIINTPNSRVVTVTSGANYFGKIHFDDLQLTNNYSRYGAYGQSKLANVLFAFELQRRLEAAGADTISNTAHPGYANTELQDTSAAHSGSKVEEFIYTQIMDRVGQSAAMGALPQLYAATAPEAKGGAFYGPDGFLQVSGYPTERQANKVAYDPAVMKRFWEASERLTGVTFEMPQPA